MYANLSPGCVGISGLSFQQLVDLARKTGFAGIDPPTGEFANTDPRKLDDMRKAAGLKWGCFGLPVEFRKDDAAFARTFAPLQKLAQQCAAAGVHRCSTWILPGSNDLEFKANFAAHRDRLAQCAKVLANNNIRLGLEFVGPKTLRDQIKYTFIHTLDGMLELADAVADTAGLPRKVGLLLDEFHWYTSGATAQDIVKKLPNDRIVLVHVNDARPGRSREQQVDNERALPCSTGVIDARAFMGALKQVGYDGPLSAEPFMPELAKQPPEATAQQVLASIQRLLAL